jgi:hypothetical protein
MATANADNDDDEDDDEDDELLLLLLSKPEKASEALAVDTTAVGPR